LRINVVLMHIIVNENARSHALLLVPMDHSARRSHDSALFRPARI